MSNCHSKYSKTNNIDSDDDISFYLGLIDEFSKKLTKTEYRLHSPLVYPLNYFFSKPYNFYKRKMSKLRKNIRNDYISTRSYDRESVKRRVRRRIKIIRLKNTLNK